MTDSKAEIERLRGFLAQGWRYNCSRQKMRPLNSGIRQW